MTVEEGIQVEVPPVRIPWGIKEAGLLLLLPQAHHVTAGYWTFECTAFGGLEHVLGFHFGPDDGPLEHFEIFFRHYDDLEEMFDLVQTHLEHMLGQPSASQLTTQGYRSTEWQVGSVTAWNYILDRFGPELRTGLMKSAS